MRVGLFTALNCISLIILAGTAPAIEIMYARYPALSPDGRTIAFTYMGDIWTVASSGGEARRLTVHEAEDIRPQYSPDGTMILFSSRRYNNYDLFIIPATGGPPRRLTFYSGLDYGSGWFPGSDSVVFTSDRGGYQGIYKMSIDGGTPIELIGHLRERHFFGRISPDSRYLMFNMGAAMSLWWRRDLKASRNSDIYLQDRSANTYECRPLTDYPGHDTWPILNYAEGEVYFVSCRGDWAQVWKMPLAGGEAVPLTDFTGDGVQWLNANPQGSMLVFEQNFGIWILDPAGGPPRRVPIQINTDERANQIEKKSFTGDVQWFSLSPDEKKIAAVIHGEVFVLPAEDPKEGRRVTFTAARERRPVWSEDSRTVYYSSDRNGNYDIFAADVTTGVETQLTSSPENEVKPIVSPDGNYLVCYRGLDKIIRIDLESGAETEWVTGIFSDLGIEPTIEYDWSPDSKWLVFTMAGPTYETDIYVVSLDGEPHNISQFASWNFRPRFSDDGKIVYFSSSFHERFETYKIDLLHTPPEFFEASFDSLFIEKPEADSGDTDTKDTADKDSIDVKIDFDGIDKRRSKAYDLSASSQYPVLTPDGKKYVFIASILGKPEIWTVSTGDDPDLKQLTRSGAPKTLLAVTGDSQEVLYLEAGVIKRTAFTDDKTKTLSFTASLEVDVRDLNRQKYRETWQTLNTYFYDETFHGSDWLAARDKYAPALEHIRTEPEFRNLVLELFGELRASHLNIYLNQPGPEAPVITGETGIVLDYRMLERDGRFRIVDVIPKSPADLAGLTAGRYISRINGTRLTPETNIFPLLAGTIDHRLTLTVSERPDKDGDEIDLKPISAGELSTLRYNDLVATRRALVDSMSGGRLAYIHIPAMSSGRLEMFKEELVSVAEHRDGLIIDVRDNGGGNIAVHLLEILIKTPYFLRSFRDFPVTTENKMRSKALEKPMILLINGYSASNSEIFAEGFRKLKLGRIIGEPTAGAVIGTSSYGLIDGTRIRRPSWGAYTIEREDTDLAPRQPDILVENLPDDYLNGRDPQLVRAVEELMKELP